jgi:hypothetical protein
LRKGTFKLAEAIKLKEVEYALEPALPLMWVFTYKFDDEGYFLSYKARLVARGDLQATQEETYAATLAAQMFRLCIAIMCFFDLESRQYDALNAFANAKNKTILRGELPEGFKRPGWIMLIIMALYGLKTSPLYWYQEFTATLEKLGLEPVQGFNCIFRNDWLILIFYVDDIVAIYNSSNKHKMDEFEHKLTSIYEIRCLGPCTYFLGIRVVRDRENRKLWLLQDTYIDKLKDKYQVEFSSKAPSTPLPDGELVPYERQATPSQIHHFQQKVGSINFAAVQTRPDIAKAASSLSRFLTNPSPTHLATVN